MSMRRDVTTAAAILTLFAVGVPSAPAQAPSISVTSPVGVRPGQVVDLVLKGSNLDGAGELWTTCAGKSALSPDVENNGKDGGKCTYRVAVPADAPLGPAGVRIATPRGVSWLHLFLVDDLPTVVEAGGNEAVESAQAIEIPCAVDGRVDNLSRDFYRFRAEKGQTVSFEVWGRRLGSPLDPILFIYRANGRELNFCDDAEGLSSDPQIVHTFAEAGDYLLEVRDVQYRGSEQHFYRLRIGDFPCVNVPLPAAVRAGAPTRIDFAGISVDDAAPDFVEVPGDYLFDWWPVRTRRSQGTYHAFGMVAVSGSEEFLEREPNDTREQANRLPPGASLNGRFDRAGDVDRYLLSAKKGEKFEFAGMTRQMGAPTDLTIKVLKPDGGQLAAVDDSGTEEGTVSVTFPEDGEYVVEAADLHERGGMQYAYRIVVRRDEPTFELAATGDAINVPAGGVVPITVNADRSGYGGEIALSLTGLPAGFTAAPATIGPGMNSTVLTVEASPDAEPARIHPVQIVGTGRSGDGAIESVATVVESLRGQWNSTTLVPLSLDSSLAVAAAPKTNLRLRLEPAEVSVAVDQKVQFKIKLERGAGLEEAVQLATEPAKNALPKGVKLDLKPIDKGQNEVTLELSVSKETPAGTYSIVLSGVHKKGKETTTVWTPALTYRVTK